MKTNMASSCLSPPFVLEISSFANEKSRHSAKIMDHYFNHAVTLILPETPFVPESIDECFTNQMSYKLFQLPVFRLLEMPFINAFVKKGAVHMISRGTKLDTHDCAAITPTGWLILHLTKDTYQELGLDGAPQTHIQKKSDIFVVKINLLADYFHPGKRGYDKSMWCLRDRIELKFNFLISWIPHDSEICSSSVGAYFSDLCDKVENLEIRKTSKVLTSIPCPRIIADEPEGMGQGCHFRDVFEWMGGLACDVDVFSEVTESDSFTSTLTCPIPNTNCPQCCVYQVRGFIPPDIIHNVLKALREHVSQRPSTTPPSLTVHGFSDSPVLSKNISHNFYIAGSNIYSFLILPGERYWLYTVSVS